MKMLTVITLLQAAAPIVSTDGGFLFTRASNTTRLMILDHTHAELRIGDGSQTGCVWRRVRVLGLNPDGGVASVEFCEVKEFKPECRP